MTDPTKHLEKERRAVEAKIREAFRGVTREGGVSWSEAAIIDSYGSDKEREQARSLDTEPRWEDLVDDPNWHHDLTFGGFSFLDPIGFRYYIAPTMIRYIRHGGGYLFSGHLTIEDDSKKERVSLITTEQAHAIARFVRLMIAEDAAVGGDIYSEPWSHAYRVYWRSRDRGTPLE